LDWASSVSGSKAMTKKAFLQNGKLAKMQKSCFMQKSGFLAITSEPETLDDQSTV